MATVFNDITQFQTMPMQYVQLHDSATNENVMIYCLSEESSFAVEPVTKRDGFGCVRTIGYTATITAVTIQNNINELIVALEPFRTNTGNAYVRFEDDPSAVHQRKGSLWLPSPVGVQFRPVHRARGMNFQIVITRALDSIYQYETTDIFPIDP